MLKSFISRVVLCLFCLLIPFTAHAKKPVVAVSILPQKFLVEEIAGHDVDVLVLVKAGSDPHTYEPSPSQLKACSDAAVYLTIGVPFETVWLPRLQAVAKKLPVQSILGDISLLPMEEEEGHGHHHHGTAHDGVEFTDPHVWTSPANLTVLAKETCSALVAILPEKKDVFAANLQRLETRLQKLDSDLRQQLSALPKNKRTFMTFHPSWQYFAKDYGLQELAIEVEGKEPSARAMKELIDIAKEHQLRLIFIAPQFPKTTANTIATNTGAKVVSIDPLAENCIQMLVDMAAALTSAAK